MLDPDDRPVAKGNLCAQDHGFSLHGATRVAANDKQGRLTLCRYILRPPLANEQPSKGEIVELPEVGGRHHRYERRVA